MAELQKLEGKPQIGLAIRPDGTEVPADFCLHGAETYVNIHDPTTKMGRPDEMEWLPLRMTDGYHRVGASYEFSHDAETPRRLVALP